MCLFSSEKGETKIVVLKLHFKRGTAPLSEILTSLAPYKLLTEFETPLKTDVE